MPPAAQEQPKQALGRGEEQHAELLVPASRDGDLGMPHFL